MGEILSINISKKKGTIKKPVNEGVLEAGMGLKGDAHAGTGLKQVSLMMWESIEKQAKLLEKNDNAKAAILLSPGSYAENLTTKGIDLSSLGIGDGLVLGDKINLRVSAIGKECHEKCAIFYKIGDCLMPREGVFCEVLDGGKIKIGDRIEKG